MRGRKHSIPLNPARLLLYVAGRGRTTRRQALANCPMNTQGQINYWLDKLHDQGKLRRHRGKEGQFVYTFKRY